MSGGSAGSSGLRVLLLNPPYGDFTYPYHSLSYVSAPLKAAGYEVDVLDLNALWFRRVFTGERVAAWRAELLAEFEELDRRPSLDMGGQKRFAQLLQCISICNSLQPERVVRTLRSEAFYDADEYLWARGQVRAFEQLLSLVYAPYDFFTAFAVPPYEPCALTLVRRAKALSRLTDDLASLLGERCGGREYLFCGVSFAFSQQLAPGMALFPALARMFPGAYRVAGGTAVSDVYKYKSDSAALAPFDELCHFFYIGEAETGVVQFADWCRGRASLPPTQAVALGGDPEDRLEELPYVSLGSNGRGNFRPYRWDEHPPDYGWVEWGLYLAPEKRVNYSPSRGCFWNQCTFCDYGLNTDGPTAPSRTMEVEVVVAHLRELALQGVRHVYLAADAVSPKFLGDFAERLLAEGLDIRWSTQFFLTRQFTREFVEKLAASGLSVASFGLESGSSRVLELMGKGRGRVEGVLAPAFDSFRASGIGLQPLFFFGFPGETDSDRQQTVNLLLENLDLFSSVTKGGLFDLLPGSIVAKEPARFGVSNIRRREKDTIAGGLEYELASGEAPPACDAFACFNDQLPSWGAFERPWVGGIDTLHTQLYADRFGRDIFHRMREAGGREQPPWGEVQVTTSFNLEEILENVLIHEALGKLGDDGSLGAVPVTPSDIESAGLLASVERDGAPRSCALRFRQYHEI